MSDRDVRETIIQRAL